MAAWPAYPPRRGIARSTAHQPARLADEEPDRVRLLRVVYWAVARVVPFTPPRSEIPTQRARAFVKVAVRPSTIPGAGQGLFALEQIEAGVTIGEYAGDIVDSVPKVFRLRDRSYLARTGDPCVYVDALRQPEAMMRYVCHHPREEMRNVRFRYEGSRIFVETTRPVGPSEELFMDYGDTYWWLQGIVPHPR